jgi:predicted DNA-binding protein with PD1-like motif
MKIKTLLKLLLSALVGFAILRTASAQEYVSPTNPVQRGRSPGVKVKLLSDSGATRTYILVFAPGDEIMSGLYDFADKYHVKSAHFTGIGDVKTAKVGWFDQTKKMFKVNRTDEQCEITSMIGDIALYNGKPVVHAHINLATQDGIVHGGHLLEGFVTPTLEVMMTVEPAALYKKFNTGFDGPLIDPSGK